MPRHSSRRRRTPKLRTIAYLGTIAGLAVLMLTSSFWTSTTYLDEVLGHLADETTAGRLRPSTPTPPSP